MNSTRLPGKVMKDLCGKTILSRVIERVKMAETIDDIWVATSINDIDDVIEMAAQMEGINVYRGDLDNVLDRYKNAAIVSKADIVVRVTADNPLTEPRFIDEAVREIISNNLDYIHYENIPVGSNSWVMTKEALFDAALNAIDLNDKEHVVPYIFNHPEKYKICLLEPPKKMHRPDVEITVDTLEDYVKLYRVFHKFHGMSTQNITLEKVITLIDAMKGGA